MLSSIFCCIFILAHYYAVHGQSQICNNAADSLNNGKCYRFVTPADGFNAAASACAQINYNFVSIHSAFENNFLQGEASKKLGSSGLFYIGLNSSDAVNWNWVDGSSYNYWSWLPGEPAGANMCAAFLIAEGKWLSYPCSNPLPFVCETDAIEASTSPTPTPTQSTTPMTSGTTSYHTEPTTNPCGPFWTPVAPMNQFENDMDVTAPGPCPSGWKYYPNTNKCYTYKSYESSTDNDVKNCSGSIHSLGEDFFVEEMMTPFLRQQCCFADPTTDIMYIVGYILKRNDTFEWYNGEPMDYHVGAPLDDYFEFGDFVISTVNHINGTIFWAPWSSTNFYKLVGACQFYLCKIDAVIS